MMSMRAALVTSFCLLAGCAYTHLEQPTLSVVNVELIKGDLFQQQLRVRLRVLNPNDRDLPVHSISYAVELDGNDFAHGDSISEFLVPAKGETQFDVNVTTNAAATVLRMLGGNKSDPEYRIFGKVRLSSGLVRSIPFDHKGILKLH